MEQRVLGRTGLAISVLGYGAGAVGGLMVRGAPAEQERSLARALDAGITYIDTAASYGEGESERSLGRLLKALRIRPSIGTKVRLGSRTPHGGIAAAIRASLEASLGRLGLDSVDLFQLHDAIGTPDGLSVEQVLGEVAPAFAELRQAGKCRFLGLTGLGETASLRQVLGSGAFDTAQIPFNPLNPSWLADRPAGLPGQDFERLGQSIAADGVGLIGIRILAAGAMSGEAARHPVAMPDVAPIASAGAYGTDLAHARRLLPLVTEGAVTSLAEAAIRYAIAAPELGTALIGTASLEQLEVAIAAAEKGPLPPPVLARIPGLLAVGAEPLR
jgi:L-galactose dehydrogenase/L-glyceraldehyde 3-phosphate reductase